MLLPCARHNRVNSQPASRYERWRHGERSVAKGGGKSRAPYEPNYIQYLQSSGRPF